MWFGRNRDIPSRVAGDNMLVLGNRRRKNNGIKWTGSRDLQWLHDIASVDTVGFIAIVMYPYLLFATFYNVNNTHALKCRRHACRNINKKQKTRSKCLGLFQVFYKRPASIHNIVEMNVTYLSLNYTFLRWKQKTLHKYWYWVNLVLCIKDNRIAIKAFINLNGYLDHTSVWKPEYLLNLFDRFLDVIFTCSHYLDGQTERPRMVSVDRSSTMTLSQSVRQSWIL